MGSIKPFVEQKSRCSATLTKGDSEVEVVDDRGSIPGELAEGVPVSGLHSEVVDGTNGVSNPGVSASQEFHK